MPILRSMRTPAAALLLAACAGGDKPAEQAAVTPAAPPEPAVITITASDFAYEMPDTVTGGMVTIKLVNKGPNLHHVQFLRLTDGKTFTDLAEGLKQMKPGAPMPPWVHDVVGPNSPDAGAESAITTNLEPGTYAVICFVDTPDKVPHFAKGMMHPLTVVAPTGPTAAAPTATVTVAMTDYAWDVAPAFTAGKQVVKLVNNAEQSHEMFVIKLAEGKTVDDLMKWGATFKGPMPGSAMGGISGMPKGGEAYLSMDLTPGNYVLLCFLPDAKDGKPHIVHGMMKPFTIS